jgi:hypothetical protein
VSALGPPRVSTTLKKDSACLSAINCGAGAESKKKHPAV